MKIFSGGALVLALSVLAGCTGGAESVNGSGEEIQASTTRTMEGRFQAGGVTGFQLSQPLGAEDHEVIAVDLSATGIAGALLEGRTLQISGTIERRKTGSLPNGTTISQDVLVAKELVERTGRSREVAGVLERRPEGFVVSIRTPPNAAPEDQDVDEVALAVTSALGSVAATLVGKVVVARGDEARRHVGVVGSSLISREMLIVASLAASL